jgi:bifunctional non-homologous end joining protein LigD
MSGEMAKKRGTGADRLQAYRKKRSADRTPEPFAGSAAPRSRLFVVQKHSARRLHYDLRLEIGGALHSWAVPKGPSLDPRDKRLAVEVEEHPLEYADFEGLIPECSYGAGAVIVWDRGRWQSLEGDPQEGLERGKLLFDLEGYKLRGRWTLVRTKRAAHEWLLIKKPDAYAAADTELTEGSILSGLTVEELREGVDPAAKIRARLKRLKAARLKPDHARIEPMLAQTAESPFTKAGWLFELKYDGFRLLCSRNDRYVVLRYRRGHDATATFPALAGAVKKLPYDSLLLDGEVVVHDEQGRPSFGRLQQRVHLNRAVDIARATVELPATLYAFDLLAFEDFDLRQLPLAQRKQLLRRLLPPAGPLRYSDHIESQGEAMYEQVREMGLEGIIAKRVDSPYVSGRSAHWLKMRCDRSGDFAVVGYSRPKSGRSGFGALHLAVHDGTGLVYVGRVGSGFDERQLQQIRAELDGARRRDPPCGAAPPSGSGHVWVDPALVCEVRFKERTAAGHLRQPVFLRLREAKPLAECIGDGWSQHASEPEPPPPPARVIERRVSLTNLDKVFWPEEGYTKGQLSDYYRVLTRYPDGITGKSFYQKDAPGFIPEWLRTQKIWSEHTQREIQYFICEDEESLLYLVNLGSIPLHLWSSRAASLQHPDWCILDLDPKQAPFAHVVRVARAVRELCEEIDLDCLVKTSGSTGLHILLPLGGQCIYEQSRTLGHLLARIVVAELPKIATLTRAPSKRGGKVYIDYLQNRHGQLLVSPFCVRPLPGAPVSTPLAWSEVKRGLDIRRFTIRSVPRRMRRLRQDPLLPVLSIRPNLLAVLERLQERL